MRIITNDLEATVDVIQTIGEIGELAKLAAKLGYHAVIEPSTTEDGTPLDSYQVRFLRMHDVFGREELASLAMLYAFVSGASGQRVLDELKSDFERREFPLDRPIQDVMEIGGGPDHQGHEDH